MELGHVQSRLRKETQEVLISELQHWAEFFTGYTGDKTPAQHLLERIAQLRELTKKDQP